jgi:fumarate reductase iron-sulfur subunit
MTLFIALNEIREKQDPSLQFDFVCRAGICGSCGMMIDGRPALACRTVTSNLGIETTLAPLPVFELIGDLSVNTGKWMRAMSERLETWIHEGGGRRSASSPWTRLARKSTSRPAHECGCCVAVRSARMRADSSAPWASARSRRFRLDCAMRTDESSTN